MVLGDIAVTRIGTHIGYNPTNAPVTFTLWFNSGIYQCSFSPNTQYSENTCDSSKIRMIGTDCSSSDTKLLIDNPSDKDAFIAGNFFFETSDGTTVTRYQSSAFCVSDDVSLPSGSQAYKTDTTCQSGIGESGHIFESVMIGSAYYAEPSKQLIHFDTSRPDDGIRDALWEDGTSVSTLSYDYNCAELIPYTAGSPLYTGDVIRAIADRRTPGKDRYSVNFKIGSSTGTAFLFSVRNDAGKVVRNTNDIRYIPSWGIEETEGGISEHLSDPTEPIELEFKITDAEYRVSSFGHRIVDYDYDFRMGETAASITNIEFINVVNGALFIFRAMPYKKGIALRTGDIIRVVADRRALQGYASYYSVNFYIGTNVAFLSSIRPMLDDPVVVRNSRINNQWGAEEKEGGWQLGDVTDSIELDFKFTDTHYEVSYFGRRIAVYDYRFRMGETAEDITDIQWNNAMNGEISIMRRSLIFGFKTAGSIGTGLCGAAAYGMVVIDLYDARGNVYRCHHLGIGCNTTYPCIVGLNENVVKLSDASNAEGFTNKLIIRGFEFYSVPVQTVFIATAGVNEGVSAIMRGLNIAHFEPPSKTLSQYYSEMNFSVEFSDTKPNFVSQQSSRTINTLLNGIDTQFGIEIKPVNVKEDDSMQQTRDSLVIGDISFDNNFYAPNDCAWNKVDLDQIGAEQEERNQVNQGGQFDIVNAAGNGAVLVHDFMEIACDAAGTAASLAKGIPFFGNALMFVNNVMDVIGVCLYDCGPSDEELMIQRQAESTKRAMKQMTKSVKNLMECNSNHTELKFTLLKEEMDGKIGHLATKLDEFSQKVDAQIANLIGVFEDQIQTVYARLDDRLAVQQEMFDMKLRANEYKIHIENVEVEVAKIQDTLDKLKRQWDHINVLRINDEAFGEELSSMLQFTMPRFAGVVTRKPKSDEFDFFWRLYAEELTVFVLEIMTLRVDIWSLWVHYNANQGGIESIASIVPDYHRDFRDLNGELIVELISLLPYAIYSIIDVESDTLQAIQRMTLTDSFKEIEYRFQPRTACVWIQYTMDLTETEDLFFLGDATIAGLYDGDMEICAHNVRKWVIDQVIGIDRSESRLYTDTIPSSFIQRPDFIAQSTDYNLAMLKYGVRWHTHGNPTKLGQINCNFHWGNENSDWRDTISHSAPSQHAVVGFTWDIVPSWYCEKSYEDNVFPSEASYFHDHLSGFTTWYSTGGNDADDIRSSMIYSGTTTSATAKCNVGFAASAIKFGYYDRGVTSAHDDRNRLVQQLNSYTGTAVSRELVGFKLLCRPTSTEPDDWYRSFTLYEIVTAYWYNTRVYVYSKWHSCPIGTVIKGIDYKYNHQVGSSGRAYNSGIKLKCGNIPTLNLLDLPSSNEFTIAIPDMHHPGDSYFNLVQYISSHSILLLVMIFACVGQILFCGFRYGKVVSKPPKIEHFDHDSTMDDTDIDAI